MRSGGWQLRSGCSERGGRDSAASGPRRQVHHQSPYVPNRRGTWLPGPPHLEIRWASEERRTPCPMLLRDSASLTGSGPALPTALVPEEPPKGRSQLRSGRVPSSQRSNHRACLQVSRWRVETGHPQASPRRPSPLPSRTAAPPRISLPDSHLGSDSSVFPGDPVALHGDGRTRP